MQRWVLDSRCLYFRQLCHLRPCPHSKFANHSQTNTYGSPSVARVDTGETGMLVPVSRDYFMIFEPLATGTGVDMALVNL